MQFLRCAEELVLVSSVGHGMPVASVRSLSMQSGQWLEFNVPTSVRADELKPMLQGVGKTSSGVDVFDHRNFRMVSADYAPRMSQISHSDALVTSPKLVITQDHNNYHNFMDFFEKYFCDPAGAPGQSAHALCVGMFIVSPKGWKAGLVPESNGLASNSNLVVEVETLPPLQPAIRLERHKVGGLGPGTRPRSLLTMLAEGDVLMICARAAMLTFEVSVYKVMSHSDLEVTQVSTCLLEACSSSVIEFKGNFLATIVPDPCLASAGSVALHRVTSDSGLQREPSRCVAGRFNQLALGNDVVATLDERDVVQVWSLSGPVECLWRLAGQQTYSMHMMPELHSEQRIKTVLSCLSNHTSTRAEGNVRHARIVFQCWIVHKMDGKFEAGLASQEMVILGRGGLRAALERSTPNADVAQGESSSEETFVHSSVDAEEAPADISAEEAEALTHELWASAVEHNLARQTDTEHEAPLPTDGLLLTFSRDPKELDIALLGSDLAVEARGAGAELQLAWANGSKIFIPGVGPEHFDMALCPRHVVIRASDEDAVLELLQQLPSNIRPRLKQDHGSKEIRFDPVAADVSDNASSISEVPSDQASKASSDPPSVSPIAIVARTFIHLQYPEDGTPTPRTNFTHSTDGDRYKFPSPHQWNASQVER
eukprot:TRINITY_DN36444_c0_g1_i1.p1 TRINITY_DN36444_c0_g1~~TRINITY_DN36444_c0_g1_i1.p1  ORF type:complete len:655 (-),score=103.89 TRINITY_DN36444_c0_g1_i1:44-2008(-)